MWNTSANFNSEVWNGPRQDTSGWNQNAYAYNQYAKCGFVRHDQVWPVDPVDEIARTALGEMTKCSQAFNAWGTHFNNLPDSPLTAEFRGALQGLQSQSNAAVDASKEVIKRHLEFCHLVSDNLHSASQAGWVQYDQRIIGASNGINFASSDLCWKVKILQEGIDYFLRIVESVNTGAAAHKASWWSWGRIKEAVPAVLRTTGYIMAGAGTVLRIIHPAGALVENMMQAVQNLLSASANRMERSLEASQRKQQDISTIVRLMSTLAGQIQSVQEALVNVNTGQAVVQLHNQALAMQMRIDVQLASAASMQWSELGMRLNSVMQFSPLMWQAPQNPPY